MASLPEIAQLKTQLLKSDLPSKQILEILSKLSAINNIDAKILSKTEIGHAVSRFRKHQDDSVADSAKALIKKWKRAVEMTTNTTTTTATTTTTTTAISGKPASASAEDKRPKEIRLPKLTDPVRDKSLRMIHDALAGKEGDIEPSQETVRVAVSIEEAIFENQQRVCSDSYRERVRTIFLNLRDKSNVNLREHVRSGTISAAEFSVMSAAEMKSQEREDQDRKMREENLFLARGAAPQEAETDQFKCGKCKQRKCRYYQMQTRSADEPMTTFVTCANCGNKWKFC